MNKKITHLWLFQLLADFAAVTAAYYTVLFFRFHSVVGGQLFTALNRLLGVRETGELSESYSLHYMASAPRMVLLITMTVGLIYALNDLYSGRRFMRHRPAAWSIIVANIVALAIFYTYFYLSRNIFHPRSFIGPIVLMNIIYGIAFRTGTDRLLALLRSRYGYDQHRAVLFGKNREADFVDVLIAEVHPHGIEVVDRIAPEPGASFEDSLARLHASAAKHGADMIISMEKECSVGQVMQILELGEKANASVKVLSDKLDVLAGRARLPVDLVHGIPLVHFDAPRDSVWLSLSDRVVSVAAAFIALVVLSPLLLVIIALIKATSAGPVLFVQERMGVNRKPFMMLKFRTMYDRAEELRAQIEEFNESGGGLFKIKKDSRVTPVGRFLRRFSLDELPQLMNVIRGEMSIVGPRPLPRRDFENYYEDWHYSRHSGMPGLTCLWQVSGRSDLDFHNMCILDVFYLRNRNWMLNLSIVLKTCWVVLFAKGAY